MHSTGGRGGSGVSPCSCIPGGWAGLKPMAQVRDTPLRPHWDTTHPSHKLSITPACPLSVPGHGAGAKLAGWPVCRPPFQNVVVSPRGLKVGTTGAPTQPPVRTTGVGLQLSEGLAAAVAATTTSWAATPTAAGREQALMEVQELVEEQRRQLLMPSGQVLPEAAPTLGTAPSRQRAPKCKAQNGFGHPRSPYDVFGAEDAATKLQRQAEEAGLLQMGRAPLSDATNTNTAGAASVPSSPRPVLPNTCHLNCISAGSSPSKPATAGQAEPDTLQVGAGVAAYPVEPPAAAVPTPMCQCTECIRQRQQLTAPQLQQLQQQAVERGQLLATMALPLATPDICTRPQSQAACKAAMAQLTQLTAEPDVPDDALDHSQLLQRVQHMRDAAQCAKAAAATVISTYQDTLKPDPVDAGPPVWCHSSEAVLRQSPQQAKAAAQRNLAEEGAFFACVRNPKWQGGLDHRAARSVVLDCARQGGRGPPEQAKLQPWNSSSHNTSPFLVYLPPGAGLDQLPEDCLAYKLTITDWERLQQSVHVPSISRSALLDGTTSLRPVVSASGLGVGAARVGRGGLLSVDPDGPEFECDLGCPDIKGCMDALLMAAAAAPGIPIAINHKTAWGFRFDIRKGGSWAKSGAAGGEAAEARLWADAYQAAADELGGDCDDTDKLNTFFNTYITANTFGGLDGRAAGARATGKEERERLEADGVPKAVAQQQAFSNAQAKKGHAGSKSGSGASAMPAGSQFVLAACKQCVAAGRARKFFVAAASGNNGTKSKSFNIRCPRCKKQHNSMQFEWTPYGSKEEAQAALGKLPSELRQ